MCDCSCYGAYAPYLDKVGIDLDTQTDLSELYAEIIAKIRELVATQGDTAGIMYQAQNKGGVMMDRRGVIRELKELLSEIKKDMAGVPYEVTTHMREC